MPRIATLTARAAATAVLIAALAACAHHDVSTRSAGANEAGAGGTTLVPAGTVFYGKLQQPIDTKTSRDGDTFVLLETDTFLHKNPALHGAAIDGHLEDVSAAGPMHNPKLTLVFDDLRMPDGTKTPIDVRLESFKAFSPQTHHLRTLGMMVGGAIAGHEVAKRTGTGHGGLMGAAGGYALSQGLKTNIVVPAGTVIQVRFAKAATSAS